MLNFISTLPRPETWLVTKRHTTTICNGAHKLYNNKSRNDGDSTLFVGRCNLGHYSSSFSPSHQRLTMLPTTTITTPSRCHPSSVPSHPLLSPPDHPSQQQPPCRTVIIHCRRGGSSSRNKSSSSSSSSSSSFASTAATGNSGPTWGRYGGDGRRRHRVGELIRREIGVLINGLCSGIMKGAMVSVVNVKCSDDLRNARVHVSVFGGDEDEAVTLLRKNTKEIRYRLAQTIDLKYMPQISFHKSEMTAATKTVNIINQLEREREEEKDKNKNNSERKEKDDDKDVEVYGDDDLDYDVNAKDALL